MINKTETKRYRFFQDSDFCTDPESNIIVSDSRTCKSTSLDIIMFTLRGRSRAYWPSANLSPYFFKQPVVKDYLAPIRIDDYSKALPEVLNIWDVIPIYLKLFLTGGNSDNAKVGSL